MLAQDVATSAFLNLKVLTGIFKNNNGNDKTGLALVPNVAQFAHITEIKNQLTEEEPIFTGFVFNVVDGKGNVTKTVRQKIEVPEILYPKKQ